MTNISSFLRATTASSFFIARVYAECGLIKLKYPADVGGEERVNLSVMSFRCYLLARRVELSEV